MKIKIFLLFFLILGCEIPNIPPVIYDIIGLSEVIVKGTYYFECVVINPDKDTLTYHWTATSGTLHSTSEKRVKWTAPETSGNVMLSCEVNDGRGGKDQKSKLVVVKRWTDTIIDWQGWIANDTICSWKKYLRINWTIEGHFQVMDGDSIKFLILDEENFRKWENGETYTALIETGWSRGTSFSAVIPASGDYYIILDNLGGTNDVSVRLIVQITSP